MPVIPTGTVTFFFTDIEGSTTLWERYPDAMKAALARHDALLRRAIEGQGGYVFKTVGDAFCAAFATAPEALTAALTAQRLLYAEAWGETGPLRVRMALHTGNAEERDGDYFGPALNRVARLLAIGHGGQILLSLATEELVRDGRPCGTALHDLGECRLKDLIRPEHVFQLVTAELPANFPPLKSLDRFPNNLPVRLTSFIGREREIAEVRNLLSTTRLLTLTGSGGCGKTRLALQVAAELVEIFTDGVWFVEFATLADPALVPPTVASVLGVWEDPHRPMVATLADFLHSKHLLLVLDNCEHLIAACATLAHSLLRACPRLRILVTSREVVGMAGETVWRVPCLTLPDRQQATPIASLAQYEAVRLFIDRAIAVFPAFMVTNQNAPWVAQVCHRLDGIPLAIELAAARVKVLTVEQIAARLDDRFWLLTGGSRTALPRQQTLQATIDWSYELLSEPERTLWQRLSVLAGGWTLEAAEAIGAGGGVGAEAILDLLASLVDKSLVVVEEQAGEARYRLLETIRQYGGEKLRRSGEAAVVRQRHQDWYRQLAERAEPELVGVEQGVWLERLEREHDNLWAALEWSTTEESEVETRLRLAGALWRFWLVRGHLSAGRRWLEAALSGSRDASASLRAKALHGAGYLAYTQGDFAAAHARLEASLVLYREVRDQSGVIMALNTLAYMAYLQEDHAAARVLCDESLVLGREVGNKRGIATSLNTLGYVAARQGDYALAQAQCAESLTILREVGDKRGIATSLNILGLVAYARGDDMSARTLHEEVLAVGREVGDKRVIAVACHILGRVAARQGDYAAARTLCEESLAIRREMADKPGIAASLNTLGHIAACQGNYALAHALCQESLVIRQELAALGDRRGIAACLETLATVVCGQGQPQRAARLYGVAEALREAIGAPQMPSDRTPHDRAVAALRAALDETAFAAAWAEGQAMTLEQAIRYAVEANPSGAG